MSTVSQCDDLVARDKAGLLCINFERVLNYPQLLKSLCQRNLWILPSSQRVSELWILHIRQVVFVCVFECLHFTRLVSALVLP